MRVDGRTVNSHWKQRPEGGGRFAIGLIRGRIADENPLKSTFETLFIGGSAAAVAFLVGWLLEGLATA